MSVCLCIHIFSVHLHAVPYLFFESEIVVLNYLNLTIYSAQEHTYMYMYMHV